MTLGYPKGDPGIRRQCALLGVARSSVYRAKTPANDNDLTQIRRVDELFSAWPFLSSSRMTAMLSAAGERVDRKRVQRLIRRMGIVALGPKPSTTKPVPSHKIYRYLLRVQSTILKNAGKFVITQPRPSSKPLLDCTAAMRRGRG